MEVYFSLKHMNQIKSEDMNLDASALDRFAEFLKASEEQMAPAQVVMVAHDSNNDNLI